MAKTTDPGAYRHRLKIWVPAFTTDAAGQRVRSFSQVGTMQASIRPLTTGELTRAKLAAVETTHEIRTRFRAGITTDNRLTLELPGQPVRTFDIAGVTVIDELRAEMVIRAIERT